MAEDKDKGTASRPAETGVVAETGGRSFVTADQVRKAQQDEYGTFVALEPIDHNGARAYNTGDPVPASNVELHGYLEAGQVARRSTKAAQAILNSEPPAAG